ncbi:hypothetical protein KAX97_11655 [candidate division WOR-3 bacterium]|nr:hypothetical protein [candidate division WOR-3 bacterium]
MKYLGSDLALDEDGDLKVTNGDIDVIEGRDCLAANLLDRMLCSEGELLLHKVFGAGLADRISMPMGQEDKDALAIEVKHEILKDPRVDEVTKLEVIDEGRIIYIRTTIKATNGQVIGNLVFPFEMEMAA